MRKIIFSLLLIIISNGLFCQIHVALTGTKEGAGTVEDPVDLMNVLVGKTPNAKPEPGDTIYIHEGRYKGYFDVWIGGTEDAKIVIQAYENDVVIIDGYTPGIEAPRATTFFVANNHLVFKNLFFTSSNPQRVSAETGSNPSDIDWKGGIDLQGLSLDVINCIFYDLVGGGIGHWRNGGEVYGNILFNNGWDAPDRGHGHSFYLQNDSLELPKNIENNMSLNGFMYGVKIYTTNTSIRGFTVTNNIAFNAAILSEPGEHKDAGRNIFVGGRKGAEGIRVDSNYVYKSEWGITQKAPSMQLGWNKVNNDIKARANYIVGGNRTLSIEKWESADIKNNTVVTRDKSFETNPNNRDYIISYIGDPDSAINNISIDNNAYFTGSNATPIQVNTEKLYGWVSTKQWQDTLGFDHASTFLIGEPSSNVIKVIPNKYETGRAHIVVYNWEGILNVQVDVSEVLSEGDKFYLYDSENLLGGHVLTGYYNGTGIEVPMDLTEVQQPNGNAPVALQHTTNEFGAFLLTTKPLRSKVCDIDFESISPEIIQNEMKLNFALTGECTMADLSVFNENNELVYAKSNVEPGSIVNFAEVCPTCPSGNYKASVESDYLKDSVEFIFDINSIALDTKLLNQISCSPNPTKGQVQLSFGTRINENISLEILNHLGQVVYSTTTCIQYNTFSFEIPGAAGIYFMKINMATEVYTKKIIKK